MYIETTRLHQKYGSYYLLLAMLMIPYGQMLGSLYYAAYPVLSCLMVSWAYLYNNPGFLAKNSRTYPWFSRIFYAPYLLVTWCTWRYYKHRVTPWTEITSGILLGRRLDAKELQILSTQGGLSILDLVPEMSEPSFPPEVQYKHLPILDLTPPSLEQLITAVSYIDSRLVHGRVFIHCKLGLSRSAVIAAAYLINRGAQAFQAQSLIYRLRPEVVIPDEMSAVLVKYEQFIRDTSSTLK